MARKTYYAKDVRFSQIRSLENSNSNPNSNKLFMVHDNLILKLKWKNKLPRIAMMLLKKNEVWKLAIINTKSYYKDTIKRVYFWHRGWPRAQWNRRESPGKAKTKMEMWYITVVASLISGQRGVYSVSGARVWCFSTWEKIKVESLFCIRYKNQFLIHNKVKCQKQNFKKLKWT